MQKQKTGKASKFSSVWQNKPKKTDEHEKKVDEVEKMEKQDPSAQRRFGGVK